MSPLDRPLLGLLASALLALACVVRADTVLNVPGHRLVWNDEFEAPTVDRARWDVSEGVNAWYQRASDGRFVEPQWFNEPFSPWLQAGTINSERQYYSPNNVAVDQGVLVITAKRETVANPVGLYDPGYHRYTSGKLNTADEFRFRFGIVRWRAQLPAGQGMWPALWMLNAPNPWYWEDEIDIMEGRGSQPTVTTSAHHFKVGPNRENRYNSGTLDVGVNLQQGFHEYGLEWTSSRIRTNINDRLVLEDTQGIPQTEMFLIMNAAVGGHFDGVPASDSIFPSTFKIDWVRVWQPASSPSDLADGDFEKFQGPQWANWNTRDDGNLKAVTSGAIHGAASVHIGRRKAPVQPPSAAPNLLLDGTAGAWSAWLNQINASGTITSGSSISVSSIPATASGDSVTLRVHQTAPSPNANAVVFRQVPGLAARGRSLEFSGMVAIEQAFPQGADAIAFIRIFRGDYTFTDVKMTVRDGGPFLLRTTITATDVPFIQVGLETTGPTGSAGRLVATGLKLVDAAIVGPTDTSQTTGFSQTVAALPGQTVRYGAIVANSTAEPLPAGAGGRLRLEFLDAANAVIGEVATPVLDASSPAEASAWTMERPTPAGAAWARLSIERFSADPANDPPGGFVADVAFLQVPGSTALPVFTREPRRRIVVKEGTPVSLDIGVSSASPLATRWYHRGQPHATSEDLSFVATRAHAGPRFAVASNTAGPVVGAITTLTVLDAGTDTDGDGISDADEVATYSTDPLLDDSDRDGQSDYAELFVALTDPADASDSFRIADLKIVGAEVEFTFATVAGVEYVIESSTDLVTWTSTGPSFVAEGTTATRRQPFVANDPTPRFFRVTAVP